MRASRAGFQALRPQGACTSIANLLHRVTSRQKKRERKRRTDYHDMVRQIAEGKEPATDDVDHLLHDTGKTVEELAADVEVMTRRLQWREAYDKLPAFRAELESMQAQIDECDKALKAAQEKHDEDTNPLYARMATAKRGIRDAEEAHRNLTDTCLDEDLLAELDEVTARLKAANNRRVELEYEIRSLRDGAESDLYEIRFSEWPSQVKKLEQRAEERKEKADSLDPELEQVRAEIADLDKREKELREQLLQP